MDKNRTGGSNMKWNAELYDSKHEFVSAYGRALLSELDLSAGQVILDLGCGTGKLSGDLAAEGAQVVGMDSSPQMIERAKEFCPDLEFLVADATNLPFENIFDIIFSNAVFHWIPNQDALLHSVLRALKPGGILLCEFGGDRNTELILNAFREEFEQTGHRFENPFYYPSVEDYRSLLEAVGFEIEFVRDFDRPTPLEGGTEGIKNWMRQFYIGNLSQLSETEQEALLEKVELKLKPHLWKDDHWIADYRRIQAKAKKPRG